MKSLADENYERAYETITEYECSDRNCTSIWDADDADFLNTEEPSDWILGFQSTGLGLYTIFTKDRSERAKKAIDDAMNYFSGSFSFECKELFINNAYGYQLELPRIIID